MKYILLSEKPWHRSIFDELSKEIPGEWLLIDEKGDFTLSVLEAFNPDKIFIPHWSYLIPEEIYGRFECILFHMTDLPYGRGGSPLQNLIERGHKTTMISAIRVEKGLDCGGIYLKRSLSLFGTAQEIFLRSARVIKDMIVDLHTSDPEPVTQSGEPVVFARRTPAQSNLAEVNNIEKLYDHIRMLDCEGYPPAFLETDKFRLEFSRASIKDSKTIVADVRIIQK